MQIFVFAIFFLLNFNIAASGYNYSDINVQYRLRGLAYPNLDYDAGTVADGRAYYNQALSMGITGRFDPGIEITAKFKAIGMVNSSFTITDYSWQSELPYNNTDFIPFLSQAYIKLINFNRLPVDIVIGKQPLEYGSGMIISDNGLGLNAIRLIIRYPLLITTELVNVKIKENFQQGKDFDINGITTAFLLKKTNISLSFFQELDESGTVLFNEIDLNKSKLTKYINRQFYSLRLAKETKISFYSFEYALSEGNITKSDDTKSKIHSSGWIFSGALIGERTQLGKVTAKLTIAGSSSGDLIAPDDETYFNPTLRKRFDGIDRTGWGELFNLNLAESAFDTTQKYFSGMGVFAVEIFFTPLYGWDLYLSNFLYSASGAFFPQSPKTSFFEQTYLNQKYNLGAEMDMGVKFKYSKYLSFTFSFCRYTPPNFTFVWPKSQTIEMFKFDTVFSF